MLYTAEYTWFNNFTDSDLLWLDESINWDDVSPMFHVDYMPIFSLTLSYFANTHHATDWLSVSSFIEPIFLVTILNQFTVASLYYAFIHDISVYLSSVNGTIGLLFHADYQDFITTLLHHSPELVLALSDWSSLVFSSNSYNVSAGAVFDTYQDTPNSKVSEFVESFILLITYVWFLTLTINVLRIRVLARSIDPYITRAKYYFFSLACERRLQAEAVLEAVFFSLLFLTMMIMTFDDDREEVLEFFNLHLFYIFLVTFAFHAWKYSTHYLSFLDSARSGMSTLDLLTQFVFDLLNLFGFTLRFLLLMVRLNLYDFNDDLLESLFVFFVDFDEEEYFMETLPNGSSFSFFDTDVQDDRSFFLEDEADLIVDLYTIYAVVWGKYVLFVFFIVEEFARVGIAFFVTYSLMFEINAVNRSRSEDMYISAKRA